MILISRNNWLYNSGKPSKNSDKNKWGLPWHWWFSTYRTSLDILFISYEINAFLTDLSSGKTDQVILDAKMQFFRTFSQSPITQPINRIR